MTNYGYISIQFYKSDILAFQNVTTSICDKDDYYYSDVVDYIQGNVSANLHLTLFYGFTDNNRHEIDSHLKKTSLKFVDLGKIFLMPGYKDLYRVLCVEVLDKDLQLLKFSNSFKLFNYDSSVQSVNFQPHLSLAYVRSDYKLKNIPVYPNSIKIKGIKYFEK